MDNLQLIEAAKNNDRATANELIESGADVNQQDEQGWTPLNWAAGRGDLEMVRLLIDKGADVLKVGRDQRTAYKIALAAGRAEAAKLLREVENRTSVSPVRPYTRAYHLSELQTFPGFAERKSHLMTDSAQATTDGDPLVFIHQDLTVTSSMWHTENVILDTVTPEWREFCESVLRFKVPDDLDLIAPE